MDAYISLETKLPGSKLLALLMLIVSFVLFLLDNSLQSFVVVLSKSHMSPDHSSLTNRLQV